MMNQIDKIMCLESWVQSIAVNQDKEFGEPRPVWKVMAMKSSESVDVLVIASVDEFQASTQVSLRADHTVDSLEGVAKSAMRDVLAALRFQAQEAIAVLKGVQ